MRHFTAIILLVLLCTGCAHTSTLKWEKAVPGARSSSGNQAVWHLTAVNRGMFLFNLIPLWSGSATRPNRHEYKIFQNALHRYDLRRTLDSHLKKLDADSVEDVEFTTSSSGAFSLWIIWRRTAVARAVAVKVGAEDEKTAAVEEK